MIFGCESQINHRILYPGILPTGYKITRKDRCLHGAGSVLVGYKDHLNVCEEPSLSFIGIVVEEC